MPELVIPCVGAIITDSLGRLLLIRRGHEPGAGLWSLPGGRVESGETDAAALVREMREECGLDVVPGELAGRVLRPAGGGPAGGGPAGGGPAGGGQAGGGQAGDGAVLDIRDYLATVTGGSLTPGDDAADARWVPVAELADLALTDGLLAALTDWGVI